MTSTRANATHAFLVGLWLAILQVVLFLSLQLLLSSAFETFLVVVLAWLIGVGVGVWLPAGRVHYLLLAVSGVAPYLVHALLEIAKFDTGLIWVHGILIAATALLAGQFFQQERSSFDRIGTLFFWENNGFTVGLVTAGLGMFLAGRTFLLVAPAIGSIAVAVSTASRVVLARRADATGRIAARGEASAPGYATPHDTSRDLRRA
jgi:hypothetical protein